MLLWLHPPKKRGKKRKKRKFHPFLFDETLKASRWFHFGSYFCSKFSKQQFLTKKPKKTFKSILRLCVIATSFIRWGKFCLLIFHKFWKKNSISRPFWSKNSKMIFFPKNSFQSILILYDTVTSLVYFAINFIRS